MQHLVDSMVLSSAGYAGHGSGSHDMIFLRCNVSLYHCKLNRYENHPREESEPTQTPAEMIGSHEG